MSTISFIVDLLVIAEVAHYYTYWNREEMKLSRKFPEITIFLLCISQFKIQTILTASTVDLVIVIDIVIIALQVFYGLQLYNAICDVSLIKN